MGVLHQQYMESELSQMADKATTIGIAWKQDDLGGPYLLLALALLVKAYLVERAHVPHWDFMASIFVNRARTLIAGHGVRRWYPSSWFSPAWLADLLRRWPRTCRLPGGRVMPRLGCRLVNLSLANLIAAPEGSVRECNGQGAVFNVRRWRQGTRVRFGLLASLQPQLEMRPLLPGQGLHFDMVRHILDFHIDDPSGLFLEFGVHTGNTVNLIAKRLVALGGGRVYGFDSFKGLPMDWENAGEVAATGGPGTLRAGHFWLREPPNVEPNVELVVGFFNSTLPRFLEGRLPVLSSDGLVLKPAPEPLRLLHLDCDLYSSTFEVLAALQPLLAPGCVIIIDDFVNFPGFLDSGLRAVHDFLASQASGIEALEVLAAPWQIHSSEFLAKNMVHPDPYDRVDLERTVAFRILGR